MVGVFAGRNTDAATIFDYVSFADCLVSYHSCVTRDSVAGLPHYSVIGELGWKRGTSSLSCGLFNSEPNFCGLWYFPASQSCLARDSQKRHWCALPGWWLRGPASKPLSAQDAGCLASGTLACGVIICKRLPVNLHYSCLGRTGYQGSEWATAQRPDCGRRKILVVHNYSRRSSEGHHDEKGA